jgi:hypothetical protein
LQELNEISRSQRYVYPRSVFLAPDQVAFPVTGVEKVKRFGAEICAKRLFPQFQLLGDRLITADVRLMKIIQQASPLSYHHQQTPAGAEIFLVFLQMFTQFINPLSQERNLNVRGARIALVQTEIVDAFLFRRRIHNLSLSDFYKTWRICFASSGVKHFS